MTVCKLISLPPLEGAGFRAEQFGSCKYVQCNSHGRGDLPVFRIAPEVVLGDIVVLDVTRDQRQTRRRDLARPPLPGQVDPSIPSRTIVRIQKSLDHNTAELELYCALEDGKSTFKSGKHRSTSPPASSVKQWSFRAESATGAHWEDLHIYVVPAGSNPTLDEYRD